MINLDEVFDQYLETALWSSSGEDGTPLDDEKYWDYGILDQDKAKMRADCERFVKAAEDLLAKKTTEDDGLIGHEFWLTRNRHGAGFWDRPEAWGGQENADALTEVAQSFGESDLMPDDDDGLIYVEP